MKKSDSPTISACLIVKDEEERLAACLQSVCKVVDEIIVVDTGSRDSTVRVAQEFDASVFHFKWQDDFSAARNFAKAQATSEWIFQIDADEELRAEDQVKVRPFTASCTADIALVAIHNLSASVFGPNVPQRHYLARLFRNRDGIYYENAIHENLRLTRPAVHSHLNIIHHGYNLDADFLEEKRRRNGRILQAQARQEPENPKPHFYLSNQYLAENEYGLARQHALEVCRLISPDQNELAHFLLMAYKNLCLIALETGNHAAVMEYSSKALNLNEAYLTPKFYRGVSLFRQAEFDAAREVFEDYIVRCESEQEQAAADLYEQSAEAYLFQVYHLLGQILRKQGSGQRAVAMFRKAVELNPEFWIGFADLGYGAYRQGDLEQAAVLLGRAFSLAKTNNNLSENAALWRDFENLSRSYFLILRSLGRVASTGETQGPG